VRRRIYNTLLLTLLALFLAQFALVHAADATRLLLPVVANGQLTPAITTLVADDSTFVGAAATHDGRIVVTYIDRAHGNKLHVVEDAGDHVIELIAPIETQPPLAAMPAFEVSGEKQADGVPLIVGDVLHVYYTSRDAGDPTGPFRLKRLTMLMPGVQTP